MDMAGLEMFLTIVRTKSISKTADTLFLSQPTISHRLKMLEAELGFSLIVRSKGFKQIELTQEGLAFIPLAERMLALWKEAGSLGRGGERQLLKIGCADSVNVALLSPLYRALADSSLELEIKTYQSPELYSILDTRDIDVAFVFYRLYYKSIICRQVFQEKLYLVQSARPAVARALVHTDELDPARELFLKWDDPYQLWHNQWLSSRTRPRITADTITLFHRLWQEDDGWMIAPESVIWDLARTRPVFVSRLRNPPPDRCCYEITHQTPLGASESALGFFEERLTAYLRELTFPIPFGEVWQRD